MITLKFCCMITLEFCYHTITLGATGTVLHDYILLLSAVHCLARVLCTRALDFAANVVHLRQGLLVLEEIVVGTWSFFLVGSCVWCSQITLPLAPIIHQAAGKHCWHTQAQVVHKRVAPWQAGLHNDFAIDVVWWSPSHQCNWYIADHQKDKIRDTWLST